MQLPDKIQAVLAPLFESYPIDSMMCELVPQNAGPGEAVRLVHEIIHDACIAENPALVAGLWLYVDDLYKSHGISKQMKDKSGSFWHGIMHRREGDFWNAKYWLDRCGSHPAMMRLEGYEPFDFVDAVEEAYKANTNLENLVRVQREEWVSLFTWCAEHPIQE